MSKHSRQSGFVSILLVIGFIALAGLAAWWFLAKPKPKTEPKTTTPVATSSNKLVMKSIGFNLDYYDPSTNHAGDMVFTKIPLMYDQIWGDFGQQDPRSPNDPTKRNPQPTFILPLGTKVHSLIDGVVTKVEELYSGDVTIWVAQDAGAALNFETEHVSNPVVKVGDHVTSGQVIADVSPHDSQTHPGFGILEIGVLGNNNGRPQHTCPFQYLDTSVKDDLLKKISALYSAWETYLGKPSLYAQETFAMPGCVTLEPFNE